MLGSQSTKVSEALYSGVLFTGYQEYSNGKLATQAHLFNIGVVEYMLSLFRETCPILVKSTVNKKLIE